ncbi:Glutathione S-transferase [Actinidia chinensis var. chinensis]|uniref:Glutathione-dependent dehydroascorbate reductase n=1 Tax=Actinidia chinensis var. chinensis TaxID=1590841 RepID=A0A2R6R343_ACTCC|nr:Glutathione S-transferase [Actinidia chinensis var. chinensis]
MSQVRLLGARHSPYVQRAKWALNLKGVEYEYLEQDLLKKGPVLVQCNPIYKRVPVLIHGGKFIAESFIIVEYLDETWETSPLLPRDPYQRAMARFWAKFAEEKFADVMRQVVISDGENQEKEVKNAKEALEILEGELKGNKFFGGENVGFVDIIFGSFISVCLDVMEEVGCVKVFDSQKFPSLAKWNEDFLEIPAIKETLPEREHMVRYFSRSRRFNLAMVAKKKRGKLLDV